MNERMIEDFFTSEAMAKEHGFTVKTEIEITNLCLDSLIIISDKNCGDYGTTFLFTQTGELKETVPVSWDNLKEAVDF